VSERQAVRERREGEFLRPLSGIHGHRRGLAKRVEMVAAPAESPPTSHVRPIPNHHTNRDSLQCTAVAWHREPRTRGAPMRPSLLQHPREFQAPVAGVPTTPTGCHQWHRLLLPELGRFGSRDPAGYEVGISLLEYVGDRPTVATDFQGLQIIVDIIVHDNDQRHEPQDPGLGCGLYYEHLVGAVLMHVYDWAPSFGHCYSHCKSAQNCGKDAGRISDDIGNYTERYQIVLCLELIQRLGRCLACQNGICRSAGQPSDWKDNSTGFDLGLDHPTGDCETMCEQVPRFKNKGDRGAEEGPGTRRPYGFLCQ